MQLLRLSFILCVLKLSVGTGFKRRYRYTIALTIFISLLQSSKRFELLGAKQEFANSS